MRNQIDPCNYLRKSNQQLIYSLSTNSKKLIVDGKVSDSSGWLILIHYGEKGSIMCINKSQTVLVDLSPLQLQLQTSRTYFSTLFWHRNILRFQGSQCTSKWELGRAKWEILVPLTALLLHHQHCLQNIVSMAPRNLLHTEPFTHRSVYTQKLSHTGAFTHRCFYTQTLLHTDAFTQTLFTHRSTILPQFSTIKLHFVRKGCRGPVKIAFLLQFFPRAPAKGSS